VAVCADGPEVDCPAPALASREEVVADSLSGIPVESANAVPADRAAAINVIRRRIQSPRTTNRRRKHNRASEDTARHLSEQKLTP
jgi:hypothetical protein